MRARAAFAALGVALALGACSKDEGPAKTSEQVEQERAEAREHAKQGAMGEPIKALDKAAAVQDTVDQQGQATKDAVDQQTGDAPADPGSTAPTPP